MEFIEFDTDGDFFLPPTQTNVIDRRDTTVVIHSNIDAATITFGSADAADGFKAYADGGLDTGDAVINHGVGAKLMVRLAGIGANPVVIGYTA